ncbi:MAG: hypothetical protein QNJ72_35630 [Pleurocapsa sp. MO_226.B13]|nr:hypothetical protein [Pleurocapsa sp. MO_226.B13]
MNREVKIELSNRTAGLAESELCNGLKVCGRTNVGGIILGLCLDMYG